MATLKTQPTDADVDAFIDAIENQAKRDDSRVLLDMMREVTGVEPVMWGDSIVGFGFKTDTYASGRVVDWFEIGFSPRKQNLTVYIMDGFDAYDDVLSRLGKHTHSVSCLYVKRLEHIDTDVLRELVQASVDHIRSSQG